MKRWAKNLLTLASLLVFVGSVAICVRSYSVAGAIVVWSATTDRTQATAPTRALTFGITWACGAVDISRARYDYRFNEHPAGNPFLTRWGWHFESWRRPQSLILPYQSGERVNLRFGHFQFVHAVPTYASGWISNQRLVLPLWLFFPAAIPPYLWWRRRRRQGGRGFEVLQAESTSPRTAPASQTQTER